MIGKIKGELAELENNVGLVETSSGIFYQVHLTNRFIYSIQLPKSIEVYTYHHIREDTQQLFGFENKTEYHIFELLLSVPGVGPKSAFHIISVSKPEEIVSAVRENNRNYFTQIKGLGKKTALKIILELSQKFSSEFIFEPEVPLSQNEMTVVDALVSLGFDRNLARETLPKVIHHTTLEDKIKESIKLMSSS